MSDIKLRWRRVATWDLSPQEQVLFVADGRELTYLVARAGTADEPRWWLYTSRGEVEGCCGWRPRLGEVKSLAVNIENNKVRAAT
jgi:hypothetical protein